MSNSPTSYTKPRNLTEKFALELGLDPNDPEVIVRLSASSEGNKLSLLTFEEAGQLNTIAWDPETTNYTFIGHLATPTKTWRNTVTNDEILTFQGGGRHPARSQRGTQAHEDLCGLFVGDSRQRRHHADPDQNESEWRQ